MLPTANEATLAQKSTSWRKSRRIWAPGTAKTPIRATLNARESVWCRPTRRNPEPWPAARRKWPFPREDEAEAKGNRGHAGGDLLDVQICPCDGGSDSEFRHRGQEGLHHHGQGKDPDLVWGHNPRHYSHHRDVAEPKKDSATGVPKRSSAHPPGERQAPVAAPGSVVCEASSNGRPAPGRTPAARGEVREHRQRKDPVRRLPRRPGIAPAVRAEVRVGPSGELASGSGCRRRSPAAQRRRARGRVRRPGRRRGARRPRCRGRERQADAVDVGEQLVVARPRLARARRSSRPVGEASREHDGLHGIQP